MRQWWKKERQYQLRSFCGCPVRYCKYILGSAVWPGQRSFYEIHEQLWAIKKGLVKK